MPLSYGNCFMDTNNPGTCLISLMVDLDYVAASTSGGYGPTSKSRAVSNKFSNRRLKLILRSQTSILATPSVTFISQECIVIQK